MRLTDYIDKGASLGDASPCLTMGAATLSYGDVQKLTYRIARSLARAGVKASDKVAVLASNDPVAFACVFGISRAGAVWCPINPRNEAAENRFILENFDCVCLIFQSSYADLAQRIAPDLPKLAVLICLDKALPFAPYLNDWLDVGDDDFEVVPPDDIVMIAGTGGTTGQPKGVMLTGHNLETMSALTLMTYPFEGRPTYLAATPLTHAAGVLCLPIMALGGHIVIMPKADTTDFLSSIEQRRVTHTFLPPTVIYALLAHPALSSTDLSSLQCFWYGAAPISSARLEEAIAKIGPVMAQLFGQTEAPMMIAMMAPKDHFNSDGSVARDRLSSAGRPAPLLNVAIMDQQGKLLPRGERGEIVVRGSLVMAGYYKNAEATEEASRYGWHHTGDIGYLDADNFIYIVDRAKDMVITGGFNVYSVEVEQALLHHSDVQDCAVFGLPDDKWGEMVAAVVQLHSGRTVEPESLRIFVRSKLGPIKTPKFIEIWSDLPRSKVGKVLKKDIRATLLHERARS
jgi:fatty-acyl-CoA synthase